MGTTAVVLWEYDSNWPVIYQREAALLRRILAPLLIDIHHIGSTSVPGLKAKPVVDMCAAVRQIEAMDAYRDALGAAGYIWNGENGIPGRRYFDKWSDESPMEAAHLHVFAAGHPAIADHLRFRDHLRTHPQAAAAYAALKTHLQQQFPLDRRRYTDGKHEFIQSILRYAGGEAIM